MGKWAQLSCGDISCTLEDKWACDRRSQANVAQKSAPANEFAEALICATAASGKAA